MEYKVFDKPHSHDAEFYKNREMADHINQEEHRPRLLRVAEEVIKLSDDIKTIGDFGCGNGGLIDYLSKELPDKVIYGYDMQPSNVEYAKKMGRNVEFKDFINEEVVYPELLIITETLEHLPDPHGLLRKLTLKGVKYIIASTPAYETYAYHAPFHLWVWTENSFKDVFTDNGWDVSQHYFYNRFQFVIAKNKQLI